MGKRGPKSISPEVLAARGSWRAKLKNDKGITEAAIPEPPKNMLDLKSRLYWDEACEHLYEMGVLTKIDGPALAVLCNAIVDYNKARDDVNKDGTVYKTPKGTLAIDPSWKVMREAYDMMTRLFKEFGMTPNSRESLKIGNKDDDRNQKNSILRLG